MLPFYLFVSPSGNTRRQARKGKGPALVQPHAARSPARGHDNKPEHQRMFARRRAQAEKRRFDFNVSSLLRPGDCAVAAKERHRPVGPMLRRRFPPRETSSYSANAGTEYTPQWTKTPNLASFHHCGHGRVFSGSQLASTALSASRPRRSRAGPRSGSDESGAGERTCATRSTWLPSHRSSGTQSSAATTTRSGRKATRTSDGIRRS